MKQAYFQERNWACFNCATCVTITALKHFFKNRVASEPITLFEFNTHMYRFNSPLQATPKPGSFRWHRVHLPKQTQENFLLANILFEELLIQNVDTLVPHKRSITKGLWGASQVLMRKHYRRHFCWKNLQLVEICPHSIEEQLIPEPIIVNLLKNEMLL